MGNWCSLPLRWNKPAWDFLEKAHADHYELITLFYGAALERQEVNRIADVIRQSYPEQEIEVQEGGQPHYFFIIAVE